MELYSTPHGGSMKQLLKETDDMEQNTDRNGDEVLEELRVIAHGDKRAAASTMMDYLLAIERKSRTNRELAEEFGHEYQYACDVTRLLRENDFVERDGKRVVGGKGANPHEHVLTKKAEKMLGDTVVFVGDDEPTTPFSLEDPESSEKAVQNAMAALQDVPTNELLTTKDLADMTSYGRDYMSQVATDLVEIGALEYLGRVRRGGRGRPVKVFRRVILRDVADPIDALYDLTELFMTIIPPERLVDGERDIVEEARDVLAADGRDL